MVVAGGYAYVPTQYTEGLRVVDVSSTTALAEINSLDSPYASDGIIENSLLFLGTTSNTFWVVDLVDPEQPQALENFNSLRQAHKITKSGPDIFLANDEAGLLILSYSPCHTYLPIAAR